MKLFSVLLILGLLSAVASQADDAKWACKKAGKDVAVAGKTDAEKKAACEKAGGTWTQLAPKSALGNGVGNGSPK